MKVRAKQTIGVRTFPGLTVLAEGDEFDSSHPLVKARPDLFVADNVGPEAATAAPGERRSVKRAPKKKAASTDD